MEPNIGRINALCRISMGFTMLAWSTAKLSRRSSDMLPLIMAMLGGMKVAEGITSFCPLVYFAEHNMRHMCECDNHHHEHEDHTNPS
ncbi:YgaP family membrane protein [Halalkalibacter nanhaiisediminis]|uniref:Inner membrane protein YgaP-like transmembrane domain-containing protein n=1 Tax=Halalkalibacter nanhaiisediminis TaxID=688079 RepID=A0A562QH26_9BACI|nr:DUF2892 domain-containing protein [Halalkalibacter nanhaiisediminis]TWI56025.1 Protein of unknown function (DUF2892) [Halalkalibacter nanhaiisediminis]